MKKIIAASLMVLSLNTAALATDSAAKTAEAAAGMFDGAYAFFASHADTLKSTTTIAGVAGAATLAAGTYLYYTNDTVKSSINSVVASIADGVSYVKDSLVSFYNSNPEVVHYSALALGTAATAAGAYYYGVFDGAISYANGFFKATPETPAK